MILFNNKDKNNKKKLDDELDITNVSNYEFNKNDSVTYHSMTKLIDDEIYKINEYFTNIIASYQKNLESSKDPILAKYQMNYADFRYMYEELINLLLLDYMVHVKDAKGFYLEDNEYKVPYIDTKTFCPVDIDFNITITHSSEKISKILDRKIYKKYIELMELSLGRIVAYNNKIVTLVIENYLEKMKKTDVTKNDYYVFMNQQYMSTIAKILTISNICKNYWFKTMALTAIENMKDK